MRRRYRAVERNGIGLDRLTIHPLVPAKAGIQWALGTFSGSPLSRGRAMRPT
jgi:hypothetical protein